MKLPLTPDVAALMFETRALRLPTAPRPAQPDRVLRNPMVNEHQVRAAAGLTLVLATVAFGYAYFDQRYLGLQLVSAFFLAEYVLRIRVGITRSPVGLLAGWLTRRHPPEWVSAEPKALAWTLGLALAGAMTVATNAGVRGWLPKSLCLVCLVLMWLEAALGRCLGCEIHGFLLRRGWIEKNAAYEVCARVASDVRTDPAKEPASRMSRLPTPAAAPPSPRGA